MSGRTAERERRLPDIERDQRERGVRGRDAGAARATRHARREQREEEDDEAEAALVELADGPAIEEITRFWCTIDPDAPLAGKLSCGREFIRERRAEEAAR